MIRPLTELQISCYAALRVALPPFVGLRTWMVPWHDSLFFEVSFPWGVRHEDQVGRYSWFGEVEDWPQRAADRAVTVLYAKAIGCTG